MHENASGAEGLGSTERRLFLAKIFRVISAQFPSWLTGADTETIKATREVWTLSMEGLSIEQLEYGVRQLALALTEFDKFAPNNIQFRKLCLEMPTPCEAKPVLTYEWTPPSEERRKEIRKELSEIRRIMLISANKDRYLLEQGLAQLKK